MSEAAGSNLHARLRTAKSPGGEDRHTAGIPSDPPRRGFARPLTSGTTPSRVPTTEHISRGIP